MGASIASCGYPKRPLAYAAHFTGAIPAKYCAKINGIKPI